MQFVYILISEESDYGIEQLLISVISLRKYHPDDEIILVTDIPTKDLIYKIKSPVINYINEIKVEIPPAHFSKVQRSRFIKTNLRNIIDGDYVSLDTDTVIIGKLSEIWSSSGQLCCTRILGLCEKYGRVLPAQLIEYYNLTGTTIESDEKITDFFNTAIIFCRDTELNRRFYSTWHRLWLKSSISYGYSSDQPDFWRTNCIFHNIVREIPIQYNLPAIRPRIILSHLYKGKVLHYYNSSVKETALKCRDHIFLQSVREKGITKELKKYIFNIKWHYFKGLLPMVKENKGNILKWLNKR